VSVHQENRVIIVDDYPEFTISLKKILEIEEINIRVFSEPVNFVEFTRLFQFNECKVLIVDYSMPKLTGFEVFERVFEECQGRMPKKMILYTANIEQIGDKEKKFLESIGVEIIKKPNIAKIIQKITENIEEGGMTCI
jgi:FixJ family two-component response regulator